jgi:hypothetical protein
MRDHPRAGNSSLKVAASEALAPGNIRNVSAEVVQHWVDRAAHFNMYSTPDPSLADPSIYASDGSGVVIGMKIAEVLNRFNIITQPPDAHLPIRAKNIIGEPAGKSTHRWLFTPDDFIASPDQEPPPTAFDPSRSQRFVMLDSICTFGSGKDGFFGFGTGQTFPAVVNGQSQTLATAIGTITEGFGKFKEHEEGTYVYCGQIAPEHGFMGNVLLRVADRQQVLSTENDLPLLLPNINPEPQITYILFRGQAVPSDPVTPRLGADGKPAGLIVEQGIRLLSLDFSAGGHQGIQSAARVGPLIGRITAHVTFNPAAPGGTLFHPIPFTAYDEFVFQGYDGERIGSFTANSTEGRVFSTQIAGQPGIRFGGTGQISGGTGPFEGINGLMTDNSVVIFTPHVSASLYMLRVHDPRGKFRAAIGRACR